MPLALRNLGEVGEQERGQPKSLHLIGDREGDLCPRGSRS